MGLFDFYPDINLDGETNIQDGMLYTNIVSENSDTDYSNETYGEGSDYEGIDFGITEEDLEEQRAFDEWQAEFKALMEEADAISMAIAAQNTSSVKVPENLTPIELRKMIAEETLQLNREGRFDGSVFELKVAQFICSSNTTAAKYLTTGGIFLYGSAIQDNFKLPFTLTEEENRPENDFTGVLKNLALYNEDLAFEIWHWCLENFLPYKEYANCNDLTDSTLLRYLDYEKSFFKTGAIYMSKHPDFVEKLIGGCEELTYGMDCFVLAALEQDLIDVAKKVTELCFSNKKINGIKKSDFIVRCIKGADDLENVELLDSFKVNVFPIIEGTEDDFLSALISKWKDDIETRIREIEKYNDKYAYSGSNAWRNKYLSSIGYGEPHPKNFDTEEDFLKAYNNPNEKAEIINNENSNAIYKYCNVIIPNFPGICSYLIGDNNVEVGQKVLVKFGKCENEVAAKVVAVGEGTAEAFSFPVSEFKSIIKILE